KEEMMKALGSLVAFRDKEEDEDFWKQMDANEIEQLASSNYSTIGAHGYYHNDLTEIAINECGQELTESKLVLEKLCRKKINSLAFPYGNYTRQIVDEA